MNRNLVKKAATEGQLLMILQFMGFAIDEVILDCKMHNCRTIYSDSGHAAFYIAYCSVNAHYLCAGLREGEYTLIDWFEDEYFSEENVAKEDLIALLMCRDN